MIDRGPASVRAVHRLWACGERFDDVIRLPGNHEGLLLDALRGGDPWLWYVNGGAAVMDEIGVPGGLSPLEQVRCVEAALPEGWADWAERSPSHAVIGDLLFVHAGIHPHVDRAEFLKQGLRDVGPDEDLHWAWVRQPFLDWRNGWDAEKRVVVIHGHSVEWREDLSEGVLHYAVSAVDSHRRINLDINACKIGAVAVLEAVEDRYRVHLAG